MKNFKKILPAIALAGAGIIAIAGAGNASAYDYSQRLGYFEGEYDAGRDPSDVQICYTLSNIRTAISGLTYTVGISTADGVDLSNVTKVSNSDSTYNYSSSSSTSGSVTISFDGVDGSSSEVKRCAHLNFSTALARNSAFDTYTVTLGTMSVSPSNYPVDTTNGKVITFGYQLSTDANGEPTTSSGTYQSEYWVKSVPTAYSSAMPNYGHIELTKKVKGNAANPNADFGFKVNVAKKNNNVHGASPDYDYLIYTGVGDPIECTFGTDCSFTLKHGQVAYIGCEDADCVNDGHLERGGVSYTITETDAKEHDTYIDGSTTKSTTRTTGSVDLDAAKKEHTFVNEKTNTIAGRFFNILPFIILAILATVGVVTLRKANKKNEA